MSERDGAAPAANPASEPPPVTEYKKRGENLLAVPSKVRGRPRHAIKGRRGAQRACRGGARGCGDRALQRCARAGARFQAALTAPRYASRPPAGHVPRCPRAAGPGAQQAGGAGWGWARRLHARAAIACSAHSLSPQADACSRMAPLPPASPMQMLPEGLFPNIPKIKTLDLTSNALKSLPEDIGVLT